MYFPMNEFFFILKIPMKLMGLLDYTGFFKTISISNSDWILYTGRYWWEDKITF